MADKSGRDPGVNNNGNIGRTVVKVMVSYDGAEGVDGN